MKDPLLFPQWYYEIGYLYLQALQLPKHKRELGITTLNDHSIKIDCIPLTGDVIFHHLLLFPALLCAFLCSVKLKSSFSFTQKRQNQRDNDRSGGFSFAPERWWGKIWLRRGFREWCLSVFGGGFIQLSFIIHAIFCLYVFSMHFINS